jgi:transposase
MPGFELFGEEEKKQVKVLANNVGTKSTISNSNLGSVTKNVKSPTISKSPKRRPLSDLSDKSSSAKSISRNKEGFFKNRSSNSPKRDDNKKDKRAASAMTNDKSKISANLPSTNT